MAVCVAPPLEAGRSETIARLKLRMNVRPTRTLALRLPPGTDVRQGLEAIAQQEQISAGVIMGAVGSLSQVRLRFAGADTPTELAGKHEILTLSGLLSQDGLHLHMMVANAHGECKGGHLVEGCQVYTTLELVIACLPDLKFERTLDSHTGFKELVVSPVSKPVSN